MPVPLPTMAADPKRARTGASDKGDGISGRFTADVAKPGVSGADEGGGISGRFTADVAKPGFDNTPASLDTSNKTNH